MKENYYRAQGRKKKSVSKLSFNLLRYLSSVFYYSISAEGTRFRTLLCRQLIGVGVRKDGGAMGQLLLGLESWR